MKGKWRRRYAGEGLPCTPSLRNRGNIMTNSNDFECAIAKQRELDRALLEEEWRTLAKEAGGGERGEAIVAATKQLYSLYTPSLIKWFAELYDPTVGGFYATTSGHDTEGFGPDVEATMQTLHFIRQCGMIREIGPLEEALPENMKQAMLRFAKGLQNPNGYFYHPQWSFDDVHSNLSRRGRDLGWALTILDTCGGKPTYDTPNGREGDGLDVLGRPVEKPIQEASGGEKPASSASIPEYLVDKDSFLRYLSEFDMKNRSYHFGNQLNATVGQIKARSKALLEAGADYSLSDILINWLNERIDPETGYWSSRVDMEGTNGFFKLIGVYNTMRAAYPAPEQATVSVLSIIEGDEVDPGNCCSLFNLWSGIAGIKKNVMLSEDEKLRERVLAKIDDTLRERGAEAILNTYRKIIPYSRPEGSFSHSHTGCGGAQQGLITGLTPMYGVNEGCVDATCICTTGLTRTLFEAFGFKRVSLFTKADYMQFTSIIENATAAKKTRIQNNLVTFDSGELPKTVVPRGDKSVSVSDGKLQVNVEDDNGVDIYPTARLCKGNVFLFEADVEVKELSDDGFVRFSLEVPRSRAMCFVDLRERNGKLVLENKKWEVGFSCEVKESFKLRVELYLDDTMKRLDGWNKKCSAIRVYADGAYLGKAINNDGTDYLFPSMSSLNGTYLAAIRAYDGAKAKLSLDNLRFSYADV